MLVSLYNKIDNAFLYFGNTINRYLTDKGIECADDDFRVSDMSLYFEEYCLSIYGYKNISYAVEELSYVIEELYNIPMGARRYCACDLQKALLHYRMRKRPSINLSKGETIIALFYLFERYLDTSDKYNSVHPCVELWIDKNLVEKTRHRLHMYYKRGMIKNSFIEFPPVE